MSGVARTARNELLTRPPTPEREETEAGERLGKAKLSLEESVRYHLYATGERERLKRLLAERLEDCGWKESVKELCTEYVHKRGVSNLSPAEIVQAVQPTGRRTVPDSIKAQLLAEIKQFILTL